MVIHNNLDAATTKRRLSAGKTSSNSITSGISMEFTFCFIAKYDNINQTLREMKQDFEKNSMNYQIF
jgi:hypothetical protein